MGGDADDQQWNEHTEAAGGAQAEADEEAQDCFHNSNGNCAVPVSGIARTQNTASTELVSVNVRRMQMRRFHPWLSLFGCIFINRLLKSVNREKGNPKLDLSAMSLVIQGFEAWYPKSFRSLMMWAPWGGTMISQAVSPVRSFFSTSREKMGRKASL